MNRALSYAYGPSGVAHLVEYKPEPAWNEPDPRTTEPHRMWRSVCGYGVRFAYPELRLAGQPEGDGAACNERGNPLTPWCSGCARVAVDAGSALYAAGLLNGLVWVAAP